MSRNVVKRRACQTCRERRIKCDLTEPACLRCTQSLRDCPGFPDPFQFRDETSKVKRRVRAHDAQTCVVAAVPASGQDVADGQLSLEASPTSLDEVVSRIQSSSLDVTTSRSEASLFPVINETLNDPVPKKTPRLNDSRCGSDLDNYEMLTTLPATLVAPNLYLQHLFSLFATFVMRAPRHDALPLMSAGSRWVGYLMDQTGEHKLLDSAMKAVSLAYLGMTDPALRESSRPYYGQAIRYMNAALVPQNHDRFVVTLSSTMLLSLFEMFMSDNQFSWIHHAGGAAALMRSRDASAFRHGPARNMFLLYRHHIIIQCTYKGQACFLAQPEWKKLSMDILSDLRASGAEEKHIKVWGAANEMYLASARVPGVIQSFQSFKKIRGLSEGNELDRQNLLQQGRVVLHALMKAFRGFSEVLVSIGHAPSETLLPGMSSVANLNYVNMYVALFHIQYWTNVIMMHNLLQPLGLPPDEASNLRELAKTAALRCLQSLGHLEISNVLSTFTFAFTIRLARKFVDDEEEQSTINERIKAMESVQVATTQTTDYLNTLLNPSVEEW